MNKKEKFTKFYNELYKEILNEYYLEIEKNIKNNKIQLIIHAIILSLLPTILLWITLLKEKYILLLIILTFAYNSIIILLTKKYHTINNKNIIDKIKYKILDDLITLISTDENSKVLPNSRISKTSFEKTNLFNLENVKYTGSNFIQTTINNKSFILADMNIYTYIENIKKEYFYVGNKKFLKTYKIKKKKDIFYGCYIGSDLNKKNDSLIQIIPNNIKNNLINNKIKNYYNLCNYEIKLENLEFSKKYSVYSNDEIKSRMILTLTMMEKINMLDEILPNKKYFIFKNDNRYTIFIENLSLEKLLNENISTKRTNKEFDNIYKIYDKITKLFEIAIAINSNK